MSRPGRGSRDWDDPTQPSTSGGYRKPYSRGSESERERPRGIIKTVGSHGDYEDPGAGPSYSRDDIKKEETQLVPRGSGGDASTRGPRKKEIIYVTRPSTLQNKKGTYGQRIMLQSNHFKLLTVPDWCLYQYRIDFEPDESRTCVRKGLFRLHKDKIGPYIFDGTILFTTTRFAEKKELMSVRQSDGQQIQIIMRFVGSLQRSDSQYIQFFNIIMRKCLEHLNLQLVGRNYFDAMDNEEFCRSVIGLVVLTRYNNNTYRVEDVDFDTTPSSTFKLKTGEDVSYQAYYKKKYKIDITSSTQPMLVPKVVQEFKDWNMTLDRNLLDVPGRVLGSETLYLGNERRITASGDWARDMQRLSLLQCKELSQWVIVGQQRDNHNIRNFIRTITNVSRAMSFRMYDPQVHYIRDDKSSTYVENLEYILSKSVPQLVFCIVSNNRSDRYAAIKKKCCIDRPIASQVFLMKNLTAKSVMSIATKVAIQMNCKLGGAPWRVDLPLKGIMAIGFDICHDTNTKGKDYVAMVATVNQQLTQYFSSISMYHNIEERAEQICVGVAKAVQIYRSLNKALPMYLVIYRDGVSEGEIPQVFENEVECLKKKLEELYYGPNFKLTFILVSKRINIRLFLNRNRNPPTGTVVDDVITSPFKYDFYLVSQQVREGTIAPTLYNIISDNSGLDPGMLQTITYKLTHMYFNCSTTVRVPAPCHYAHKLSHLVGQFLHRPPNSQLEHQLFYL
ncbi:hypothetical protein DMN91_010295 [Ooceraea biroi]|uniref:Protein piwi n=1 Tax=Ooceraea biroi TaxID=2015173 RepID=A0A3L8DD38_OOCBI|nr:hypothetical protein DMN91_010295 [Ooceraea biroi]